MKKLCSLLLAVCLIIGIYTPARAAEVTDPAPPVESETVPPLEAEGDPVVVGTLEELQAAIDAAEDGDIILIAQTIVVDYDQSVNAKVPVTLTRAEEFDIRPVLDLRGGSKISGLKFLETENQAGTVAISYASQSAAVIENCEFNAEGRHAESFVSVIGGFDTNTLAQIAGCRFVNNSDSAVSARAHTDLQITDCIFESNSVDLQGGAIYSSGIVRVENSKITNNTAWTGGGVFLFGDLTITNCQIQGNHNLNPEKGPGIDIFVFGSLDIMDEPHDGAGYYDLTTGKKVELPLVDYTSDAKLIYLTDEAAKAYFAIEWTPIEPAPIIPATPLEPSQKPDDGGEDTDDDYTPPDDYRPSHKPAKPQKPVDTIPMEDIKSTPILACGDAVIDLSRSVELRGYGDGLIHESDQLSRAQMSAIIYRLLDDESKAVLSVPSRFFTDVDAADWYAPFVLALADAGVVGGTGGGHFAPHSPTTWAQLLTVLGRFVELQECPLQHIQYDGWARPSIETAVALGWIEDSAEIDPDDVITRGEAVDLINYVLQQYK